MSEMVKRVAAAVIALACMATNAFATCTLSCSPACTTACTIGDSALARFEEEHRTLTDDPGAASAPLPVFLALRSGCTIELSTSPPRIALTHCSGIYISGDGPSGTIMDGGGILISPH